MSVREDALAPVVQALKSSVEAARIEVEQARQRRDKAVAQHEEALRRFDMMRDEWARLCEAIGVSVGDVISEADAPEVVPRRPHGRSEASNQPEADDPSGAVPDAPLATIALPCRPHTQRWWAGQALHKLGDEAPISRIADEMRFMGYHHGSQPRSPKQLEASLSALPDQVSWIKRVPDSPGHLALVLAT